MVTVCTPNGQSIPGAPIDRDPTQDNPVDAADPNKVNDFDYSDDPAQVKCPFTAHLRKFLPFLFLSSED